MNIKLRIISSAVAVVTAGGFLTALALQPEPGTPQGIESPEPIAEDSRETIREGFWVGEENGNIAVWHNSDRSVPLESTDIAIRSLRALDQEMLRTGVYFEDYMDVVMFLEDFCP